MQIEDREKNKWKEKEEGHKFPFKKLKMNINIDEINKFFRRPKGTRMPRVVRELILKGVKLKGRGLETKIIEWGSLPRLSPDLSEKIYAPTKAYNIPLVRVQKSTKHFVYHPETGEYVGKCSSTF